MKWDRSETLALASIRCPHCQGLGLNRAGNVDVPCACVLRAIFRVCHNRFRGGVMKDRGAAVVNVNRKECGNRPLTFGWKAEEYLADFHLISKRTLTPSEWRIFRYVYLLGADWLLCHRYLKMSRSHFIHACTRIEVKLGRAFRETQPYSLFPVDAYFSPCQRGTKVAALPATAPARYQPLVPPLAA